MMKRALKSGMVWISAAAVMAAFIAVGCSDGDGKKDNPVGPGNEGDSTNVTPPPGGGDSTNVTPPPGGGDTTDVGDITLLDPKLVTGAGEAWVGTSLESGIPTTHAMILRSNGDVEIHGSAFGMVADVQEGTWNTQGGKLCITIDFGDGLETDCSAYTVSGNTLTVTDSEDPDFTVTFTRQEWSPDDPIGEWDPALVNTMWMNIVGENVAMWMFMVEEGIPAATYTEMSLDQIEEDEPMPDVYEFYLWRTEGGNLYLTEIDLEDGIGAEKAVAYSLAGGLLTIDGKTYTDASGMGGLFKSSAPKSRISDVPGVKALGLFK